MLDGFGRENAEYTRHTGFEGDVGHATGHLRRDVVKMWRGTPDDGAQTNDAVVPIELGEAFGGHRDLKRPGDAHDINVLIADANTGWLMHQAARVADAVREVDVYIEQPCASYEECLAIRRRTARPFVLDEVIDGLGAVLRGHADQAMDVINLKISKVGGLTRAREIRDLCVALGIAMTIEDSWGGDIVTAAIAHLAHSTPTELLFSSTDFNSYVTVSIAEGAPQRVQGRMAASDAPGLGVTPRLDVLGEPVLRVT